MPGLDFDLLDITVDIFDFDKFGVFVNREHSE